ncbi:MULTISPECIES: copper-binding protein [Actibacterium]|uniref:Putative cupredoxin-like copper-binding protein/Cu/Ag efflux protein CusF n=1 Tax=Actibacterium naphthalenivorans TaxID=1614693 RepID=A0A840CAN9_9RHOB|nr:MULTISPECIES: copper-binding protein [Actibacterium]ALG91121.1 cupredoxin [Actibacterium sp. EMB200-NS6]MBB4022465.1 putative cupredoxin-like copper-binding protein/Cu/Ag efflux protein CusF [Actibacterium naphthalenivorans]
MKKLLLTTTLAFALTGPAFAAGIHEGGHGDDHAAMAEEMMIGVPGDPAKVTRTIDVTMRETDDGEMLFEPKSLDIVEGETIRFTVVNNGELEHEFVIDTMMGNAEHKEAMAKMDMEHDDPNSVRLDPGASGEVVWTFSNTGSFEFACLIPGHYESGMHGPIVVGEQMAQPDVEYATGTIKKIVAEAGKVTIIHGPLVALDMPAMTMVFRADEDMIAKMSEGQDIEFVADRVNGKLTVTAFR